MSRTRKLVSLAIAVWVAAVLQRSVAPHLAVLGGRPDFFLILLCTSSLMLSRLGGGVLGFFSGAVYSAIAMANLQHYVISRAVTGFATGWSNESGLRSGPMVATLATVAGTLLAQFFLVFMPPPREIPPPLTDTILSALYNGVLAVPVYALMHKAIGEKPA